jgi:hypothetical protein
VNLSEKLIFPEIFSMLLRRSKDATTNAGGGPDEILENCGFGLITGFMLIGLLQPQ